MLFFFFQAEAGIGVLSVPGVQRCALPISSGHLLSRRCSAWSRLGGRLPPRRSGGRTRPPRRPARRDRKSVVLGKRVDLGGRRILKKKKLNFVVGYRICAS